MRGLLFLVGWWVVAWAVPAPLWAADSAGIDAATIDITIDLRDEIAAGRFDPARDGVGVRGGGEPLSWQRTLPAQPASEAGLWRARVVFGGVPVDGRTVAYKFKIDRPGRAVDDGWETGANRSLLLARGAASVQRVFGTHPGAPPPRRTGLIQRIAPLPSAFVEPREVQVWLPPGYDTEPQRRYPVLYLHDGQNLFDDVAAGAEWQVDETAQRLVLAGAVRPLIIVGVSSTGTRTRDYTPVPMRLGEAGIQGGGAADYGRYLVQELKPLIDARFRTQPGRDSTAVGGSSFGGLVSMWLVLNHGDVFGAALVVSPSTWWAQGSIVSDVQAAPVSPPAPRLWLDAGTEEGRDMVSGARRLRQALQARGWAPAYLEQIGAGHDETSWAARVEPMLRFLDAGFPPERPVQSPR
jgi:predicted alpha/beta superfamily hydrolase